jgi:hypothetical protein
MMMRKGGTFVCMALDGQAVDRVLGKHNQASVEGIKIQRSENNPKEIFVKLATSDSSLAVGQKEYLVDFDHLIMSLEAEGFELINDNHLSAEVVLNDSELWWSQMTRYIEMRYIGFKTKPVASKRVEELIKLMRAAIPSKGLKYDEVFRFEPTQIGFKELEGDNVKYWTVGVMGGGSCFLHAVLWSINKKYRDERSPERRFEMIQKIRFALSQNFTQHEYKSINNGNLAEFGRDIGIYSYKNIVSGLADYSHWFGLEFLTFVQNQLNVNIHIVWFLNGVIVPYKHAPDLKITYDKSRNNIILYWEGQSHFQPFGRSALSNDDASFVFSSNDDFITQFLE